MHKQKMANKARNAHPAIINLVSDLRLLLQQNHSRDDLNERSFSKKYRSEWSSFVLVSFVVVGFLSEEEEEEEQSERSAMILMGRTMTAMLMCIIITTVMRRNMKSEKNVRR